MEILSS